MLHWLRILVTVVALAPLAVAAGGDRRPGRRFVVARHGARLALFALELALTAAWALALARHHGEWPLLGRAWVGAAFGPAAVVAVLGGWLVMAARRRLGALFSPTFGVLEGHTLVTDGPYAITRHPIYTGAIALVVGLGFVWNGVATTLFGVALALPFAWHTAIEEPMLAAHFGESWREYTRRVPRLLPRVGRRPGASGAS